MTTPQHAIDAALQICANLGPLPEMDADDIAAIIARHPDPELARLREENERLRFPHPRLHETQKQLLDVIAERDQLRAENALLKAANRISTESDEAIVREVVALRDRVSTLEKSLENHAQANDKLVVEVDDLRLDAERYRFIRRFDRLSYVNELLSGTEFNTLDAAIDAARAKDAKSEGGV